ncbi:hypothetical protein JYB87_00425 [Shewanella avicenniae]|uniref:Uncharacterized protein n=1 Tax=Shewanella avicenniae TaxID=2814294 RepID=A0ABX7QSV5_9GAMM|nr:hypothetical protein [Shewanella avicenniae]QSX33756.1 hypothetical protein JYB87_00425 [Shewanella avicenniae]
MPLRYDHFVFNGVTMKFSFLPDDKSFEFSSIKIAPVSKFDDVLKGFYQSVHVSNGWFYGPEQELKKSPTENTKFKNRGPINCVPFFKIDPTHEITSNSCTDEHLRFLILSYGFLQGLYLTPEGYSYLGRTAYKPGKLNGLLMSGNDYANGMETINKFYTSSNLEQRNQMFACIHWFLLGQSHHFEWDQFEAQYKVLDGLYNLAGVKAKYHAGRPVELAKKYNLKLPLWAELDSTGKRSTLSIQRNELFHEAKYGGHPIGYSYPEENYSLEFVSFNTKLIAATLGIDTPYLSADPTNRDYWAWDIKA